MLSNLVSMISGLKVVKTVDPNYKKAKQIFNRISIDTENIIGSLIKMQNNLQRLARASLKFGENIDLWFSDASEDQQLKAKTTLSFAKHFSALTVNFMSPRVEPHVISLLAKYQAEVLRIKEIKTQLKRARKEYDKSRAAVQYLSSDSKTDPVKLNEMKTKMLKDKATYEPLNEEFVKSVIKLDDARLTSLEIPFKNLLCIMSQYMMQCFSELQKFRTTFPPALFNCDTP